ncbi:MAG: transglutaminase domain-containing protein [Anaerolineales bacterium]|nr:transglutaminase domain-containing protein [Anaerolineales bacterium]
MEKTPRWWDAPSAVLLFAATLFSGWRLQSTAWVDGLGHVRNVAILGLLIGLALGQSQFQKRNISLLSIGYMLVFFIWQWLGVIEFTAEQTYLGDKLLILFGRLLTDLGEFFSGRPVENQLLVIALLSIPYWIASLFSGYQLTRHANYLAAILPGGILMLFVTIYHFTSKDYTWMFGVYLFLALILLGRQKFLFDKKKWIKERVQVSSDSSLDLNNTSLVIAAVLIMFSWGIPFIFASNVSMKEAWHKTTQGWFAGEPFENLFDSVKKEKKPQPRNFQTELFLGNQAVMSDLVVFLVYAPSSAMDFPRLYWRGQIYDHYENDRWQTTAQNETLHLATNGDLTIPDTENRARASFTFDIYSEGQTILYSAAQPIQVNHNVIVLYSGVTDNLEMMDVMAFRAAPSLEAGDLYRVGAEIANPTILELQATGQNYPDWVKQKYLQLPNDFSVRIRALANEITAKYDNPYDKAAAITNYLRSEIRYTPGITFPSGEDVDPLEYFLFDTKQGFCNYYASTEVLMLRSIGIPARLAVGYAQGEPNLQNSVYTVRERDLHAWPEVYFPGYGWVEFEPTGNQQPLERPLEREARPTVASAPFVPTPRIELLEEEPPTPAVDESGNTSVFTPVLIRWSLTLAGFALCVLTLAFLKRRFAPNTSVAVILKNGVERSGFRIPSWLQGWFAFAALSPIERHFQSINFSLRWMKRPQPIYVTAAERAMLLQKLLPDARSSIEVLLREHQAAMFTSHGGDAVNARRAARNIIYKTLSARLKFFILGYN